MDRQNFAAAGEAAQIKTVDKLVEGLTGMANDAERIVARLTSLRDRLVGPTPGLIQGKKEGPGFAGYLGQCDEHGTRLRDLQAGAHNLLDEIERHI